MSERWTLDLDGETGLYTVSDAEGEFARIVAVRNDHERARLIAAAPELFEALKALLAAAEMTTFSDQYPLECELASAALAKAEGK